MRRLRRDIGMVFQQFNLFRSRTAAGNVEYPLKVADQQYVEMPYGAQILSAHVQAGQICLWALVDPEQPPEQRSVVVLGTGHPAPSFIGRMLFIGTVLLSGGSLVFHVFASA